MLTLKEQHWRSPATKLEEATTTRLHRAGRKKPEVKKTETYFDKPSLWLKRMILRKEENVFLFEFGIIVPAVLKCLF